MAFWMLSFICSFTHYLYVIVHDHHTNSKRQYQANSPSWKVFAVCSLSLLKSIGVVWKERNRRRRKRFFKSLLRFNHRFHPTNKLVLLPGRPFSSIGFLYLFFLFCCVLFLWFCTFIPFNVLSLLLIINFFMFNFVKQSIKKFLKS